jgi:hypothetical protein
MYQQSSKENINVHFLPSSAESYQVGRGLVCISYQMLNVEGIGAVLNE